MSYLNTYGKKRRFQEGGVAPAAAAPAPVPAGPAEGGGQEEQILALAEATVGGDQAAAAELGTMLAPMILQEVQAAAGGAEGAPEGAPMPEAQPVFKKGGKFVGTIQ